MTILNKYSIATCVRPIMLFFLFLLACEEKESDQDKINQIIDLMVGKTWKVHSVVASGVDRTDQYSGMTITFEKDGGELNYSATKASPVWPMAGKLTSQSFQNYLVLLRSDGRQCVVERAISSELVLVISWDLQTIGPGRAKSTAGDHVFTFSL